MGDLKQDFTKNNRAKSINRYNKTMSRDFHTMGEDDEVVKMKKQYSEYQKLFNRSKGSHISTHNNPQNEHVLRGTKRFDQTDS